MSHSHGTVKALLPEFIESQFFDPTEFAAATVRHSSPPPGWKSFILGAGRAFDPLPARRPSTFCKNDAAARLADITKLIQDKNAIESSLIMLMMDYLAKDVPPDVGILKQVGRPCGKTSNAFCEAE